MKNTLNQLIKLQDINNRLTEIDELKGDLPLKVKQQEIELTDINEQNNHKGERLEAIEFETRKHSAAIEDNTIKLEKFKDQLYLVKSNKEYDALNHEIDHMKSMISDSEMALLELDEEKTQLEDALKSDQMQIVEIGTQLEKNRKDLQTAMSSTEAEEADLNVKKDEMVSVIEPQHFRSYDRIREAREGEGIVSILKGACGACYTHLPPQTVIEIKGNNSIQTCPSCSVYLYWDGAED